jgi:hypothetical protein
VANKPTFLGIVQDVQGATVSASLDPKTVSGLAFIDGQGYRIGQIGSLVRIPIGLVDLFGIVSQVGAGAVPEALINAEPYGYRWLRIQLIGEGYRSGKFKRGISQYPTIGDEVHLIVEKDLYKIYGGPETPNFVRIGSLASAESIPALIDIDKIVTRHTAVIGATGTGKSTTVANILISVSDPKRFPAARIIIMDIHGEYYNALQDRATVFRVNANEAAGEKSLFIPYWALNFDELMQITPLKSVNDSERAALVQKVRDLKIASLASQAREGITVDNLTVDSIVPFSIHRLWYDLYRFVCSTHSAQQANQSPETEAIEQDTEGQQIIGDILKVVPPKYKPITSGGPNRIYLSGAPLNIRRQIDALGSLLRDTRYDFLFRPGDWCPNKDGAPKQDLDTLLLSWIGGEKPITILDLSGVPVSILVDLIGVLIRLLFDALFWSRYLPEGGRMRPLLFVLEEAHAYLNAGNEGAASIAARRIVKEGRKYGLGAMIISQRPSEIDPTILSQCGTLFAMRLSNSSDRSHVIGSVSDNLEGLFNKLPALRTGEAIIVGEAVQLPLNTLVDAPPKNRRPDSHDPLIYDPLSTGGWNRTREKEDYTKVLKAWRTENPKPGKDA